MARLSDIRSKRKFFIRKGLRTDESFLCEQCKNHKIIIIVKWSCDYYIFTDLSVQEKEHVDSSLHIWCGNQDDPPNCLKAYKDAGYVK